MYACYRIHEETNVSPVDCKHDGMLQAGLPP
jgi:hypothetical protein